MFNFFKRKKKIDINDYNLLNNVLKIKYKDMKEKVRETIEQIIDNDGYITYYEVRGVISQYNYNEVGEEDGLIFDMCSDYLTEKDDKVKFYNILFSYLYERKGKETLSYIEENIMKQYSNYFWD